MALNNIASNAPANMRDWVRAVEAIIASQNAQIAALQSQVAALSKRV